MLSLSPPQSLITAQIDLPGSKSYSNRALILSALANGNSTLQNVLESDDIQFLRQALNGLGMTFQQTEETTWKVTGKAGKLNAQQEQLFLGLSGTGCRFAIALASLLPAGESVIITGESRLQERPVGPLIRALNQLGVKTEYLNNEGCPPVRIYGGGFNGGICQIPGNISSQFFSALLLIAPYAQHDVLIEVEGDLTSKPYIDLTLAAMRDFGVTVTNKQYQKFFIGQRDQYQAQNYYVEPDASSASYFLGLASILGEEIFIRGVKENSLQGDWQLIDALKKMGASAQFEKSGLRIQGPNQLQAIQIDMNAMPDVVMTLAACAAVAHGTTKITNVANLRVKETDRLTATATELKKCGVEVEELEDSLIITGTKQLKPAVIETYDDHRMAMAFSLLAAREPQIQINDPQVVAKSFPNYWEVLKNIGFQVTNA